MEGRSNATDDAPAARLRLVVDEKRAIKGRVGDLLREFGFSELTPAAAADIEQALATEGLEVEPPLGRCKPDSRIRVIRARYPGQRSSPAASGTDPANDQLVPWGYVTGFLLPIVGVVIGIILMNKGDRRGGGVLGWSLLVMVAATVLIAYLLAQESGFRTCATGCAA